MPYYLLRPVGNAVVPLSDRHTEWKRYATIGRPYSNHREICQCLFSARDERDWRDGRDEGGLIWFIWSVWSIWFNQTHETD